MVVDVDVLAVGLTPVEGKIAGSGGAGGRGQRRERPPCADHGRVAQRSATVRIVCGALAWSGFGIAVSCTVIWSFIDRKSLHRTASAPFAASLDHRDLAGRSSTTIDAGNPPERCRYGTTSSHSW
jgi:hypothetical protein